MDQAQEYVQYIPAIASAPGVGDSFFVTDARVFNPDPAETITVQLAFLKHDANNTGVAEIPNQLLSVRGNSTTKLAPPSGRGLAATLPP